MQLKGREIKVNIMYDNDETGNSTASNASKLSNSNSSCSQQHQQLPQLYQQQQLVRRPLITNSSFRTSSNNSLLQQNGKVAAKAVPIKIDCSGWIGGKRELRELHSRAGSGNAKELSLTAPLSSKQRETQPRDDGRLGGGGGGSSWREPKVLREPALGAAEKMRRRRQLYDKPWQQQQPLAGKTPQTKAGEERGIAAGGNGNNRGGVRRKISGSGVRKLSWSNIYRQQISEADGNRTSSNYSWNQGHCFNGRGHVSGTREEKENDFPISQGIKIKTISIQCAGGSDGGTFTRLAQPRHEEASLSITKPQPTPVRRLSEFQAEALTLHNAFRKRHGVPELQLDANLCSYAQNWAERLASASRFDHRPDNEFGENLYSQHQTNPNADCSAETVVESWYGECLGYDFGCEPAESFSCNYGHFTQLVWRNTTRMGIGKAKASDGKRTVIVANYDPPGNYIGQYTQNIPTPMW